MNKLLFIVFAAFSAACSDTTPLPADPQATPETQALYRNLFRIADEGVMFGHQDDALYGHDWKYEEGRSDVRECCGDYPAVFGWELGGLETGADRSIDDVPFAEITRLLCAAYGRGAVNTVSWHPQNPESGASAWDGKTSTAVSSILPGGANHAQFRLWLPDEYKALWRFTVEYLRDVKGVHNLLYVYSPDLYRDAEHYTERYPGDEWVDVLGLDAYHRPQDWDFLSGGERMLSTLQRLGHEHGKPTAFTETGLEGIPDTAWWTRRLLPVIRGKGLSYVLVWRNAHDRPTHFFGPWHGHASEPDFRKFAANREQPVLFESQLPDMYH